MCTDSQLGQFIRSCNHWHNHDIEEAHHLNTPLFLPSVCGDLCFLSIWFCLCKNVMSLKQNLSVGWLWLWLCSVSMVCLRLIHIVSISIWLPVWISSLFLLVATSCPTLCNLMDCSPPGSSVHGILQARVLEWVAIPSSRGSSRPRNRTLVSLIADRFFTVWATREALHFL